MILTELFPQGKEYIGSWGPGVLVLTKETLLGSFYDVKFWWHTHGLYYRKLKQSKTQILLAYAESKVCKQTNLHYIEAHLGAIPLVLETTKYDSITVRAGYRTDYKHKDRCYRKEKYPHPKILLGKP